MVPVLTNANEALTGAPAGDRPLGGKCSGVKLL